MPQDSAEITFVPLGMTATTALWTGKSPSIPDFHLGESDMAGLCRS